jgi:hypothetical protein
MDDLFMLPFALQYSFDLKQPKANKNLVGCKQASVRLYSGTVSVFVAF